MARCATAGADGFGLVQMLRTGFTQQGLTPGLRAWPKGFDKLSPNGVCVARTGCLLGPDRVFARPVRVVTQPSRCLL